MQHIDKTPPQPSPWQGEGAVRRVGYLSQTFFESVLHHKQLSKSNKSETENIYLGEYVRTKHISSFMASTVEPLPPV